MNNPIKSKHSANFPTQAALVSFSGNISSSISLPWITGCLLGAFDPLTTLLKLHSLKANESKSALGSYL